MADVHSQSLNTGWQQVDLMEKPLGSLKAREFIPVRIIEKLPAVSVTQLENGNLLVDMCFNVAGFLEIEPRGMIEKDRGTVIEMYPSEI
jgi:hypothetical protein